MYRDQALWKKIQQRILVDGISIREVARVTGISRRTIRKMLANRSPVPYSARSKTCGPKPRPATRRAVYIQNKDQAKELAFDWMRSVLQGEIGIPGLRSEVGDLGDIEELARRLYQGRLSERNRSMVILAKHHGIPQHLIYRFLGIDRKTVRSYLALFNHEGTSTLFARRTRSNRKFDDEATKNAVFKLLHEPPSKYGINRTTWTMSRLSRVLRDDGHPVSLGVIRKITKGAGYRWRKARLVLTSNDAAFSEKLDRVRLANGILYQLSGSTEISLGGENKVLGVGEALFVAAGKTASLSAGSGAPSILLYFLLAPGAELDRPTAIAPATVTELYRTVAPISDLKPGGYDLNLTRVTFPPGMPSNPPHHRSGAALYYIVSGTGANTVDATTKTRGPDSLIYEPFGLVHQWGNPGAQPLTFLAFNINPDGVAAVLPDAPAKAQ
jgi:quercetin dioxygenase-like cupin family protein/transposase